MKSIPNTAGLTAITGAAKAVASGVRSVKSGSEGFLAIFHKAAAGETNQVVTRPLGMKKAISEAQSAKSALPSGIAPKKTLAIQNLTPRGAALAKQAKAEDARVDMADRVNTGSALETITQKSKKPTQRSAKSPMREQAKRPGAPIASADRNIAAYGAVIGSAENGRTGNAVGRSAEQTPRAGKEIIANTREAVWSRVGERKDRLQSSLTQSMPVGERVRARSGAVHAVVSGETKVERPSKAAEPADADTKLTRGETKVTRAEETQQRGSASGRRSASEEVQQTIRSASPREFVAVRTELRGAVSNVSAALPETGASATTRATGSASGMNSESNAELGVAAKINDQGKATGQHPNREKPSVVEWVLSQAPRSVKAETKEKAAESAPITPKQAERSAGRAAKWEEKVPFARMTQSEEAAPHAPQSSRVMPPATPVNQEAARSARTAAPLRGLAKNTPTISVTTKGKESRSAVIGHARETDRVIDKFWQERLTPKGTLASSAEIISSVMESGREHSLPATPGRNGEARVFGEPSASTFHRAKNTDSPTARETVSTETRATRTTAVIPASPTIRKSFWGFRIESDRSAATAAQNEGRRIQTEEPKQTEAPSRIAVDASKARAAEIRESVFIAKDAPKTASAQSAETPLPKAAALREGVARHPVLEPVPAGGERVEVKPSTILRQEAAAKVPSISTKAVAREPHAPPGRMEHEVRVPRSNDALFPPVNRRMEKTIAPERAPHDVQSRPVLRDNESRSSVISANGNEASAKAIGNRGRADAAETRAAGTHAIHAAKAEAIRKQGDAGAPSQRRETKLAATRSRPEPITRDSALPQATIVQEKRSVRPVSASATGATTPAERTRVASARSSETIRDFVPVKDSQEIRQPKQADSLKMIGIQDQGEQAAVARGEGAPVKQAEISRSGQNGAPSAQNKETAAMNLKAATSVRAPLRKSTPTEIKALPTESRTMTKSAAPSNRPPAVISRLAADDAAKSETKTPAAEPQTTTKSASAAEARPAEISRLPIHDTPANEKRTPVAEEKKTERTFASTDTRPEASSRLSAHDVMTSTAKTRPMESRAAKKAAIPSDPRSEETPRLSAHDTLASAARTAIMEPRKVTKPAASTTPANVPVMGEEAQKAANRQTGERPAASMPIFSAEAKATATMTSLATPPHRARLSAEQVRELQALVARTVQNARMNAFGESSTRFSMQHATLGALQFRVTTRRDDVTVEISSPSRETTETLEEARPAVERAMADAGLRMERFEIRLRDSQTIPDSMNRGLENDHQPTHDQAADESARMWDGSRSQTGEAEDAVYERPQLAEHEWVA